MRLGAYHRRSRRVTCQAQLISKVQAQLQSPSKKVEPSVPPKKRNLDITQIPKTKPLVLGPTGDETKHGPCPLCQNPKCDGRHTKGDDIYAG